MPKNVVENKIKFSKGNAITTTVMCLIPIIIIALISIGNPSVWGAPYAIFALAILAINTYFAIMFGFVARINEVVWILVFIFTNIATLALLIISYIFASQTNGLMLHTGTACLFAFMIYLIGESYAGDNYFVRYWFPVASLIIGLINVLWFVGVGMSVTAHIVITTILNLIFFIVVLVSIKHFFKANGLKNVTDDEIEYTTLTDEEKQEKQEEKARLKEEKRLEKKYANFEDDERKRKKRPKKISAKKQLALEKRNEYVSKYGENAKWVVKQSQIDDIKDNFINSANDVIKEMNSNIKINNTIINNPPGWNTQSEIDEAVKNNKNIWKEIRRLQRRVKEVKKYITKIENRVYTIDDCGHRFIYRLSNGHCKVEKYDGYKPLDVVIVSFSQGYDRAGGGGSYSTLKASTSENYIIEQIE